VQLGERSRCCAREGYAVVSLSCDEPLRLQAAPPIVRSGRGSLGFRVTISLPDELLATAAGSSGAGTALRDGDSFERSRRLASTGLARPGATRFRARLRRPLSLTAKGFRSGAAISLSGDAIPELPDLPTTS